MSKCNSIILRIKLILRVNNYLDNPEEKHIGRNVFWNHDENISRNTWIKQQIAIYKRLVGKHPFSSVAKLTITVSKTVSNRN